MKVRILGSGTSTGVPQIGCTCPVCTSADPKDNRLRASAIVETEDARILIDCGPDFRAQVLHLPFEKIDGVLITHEHYDHVGGLDDLRPFCRFGAVPIYAEEYVARALRLRMPYCFVDHRYPGVPDIPLQEIEAGHAFSIHHTEVVPLRVMHGRLPILGYRIGRLGYITDMLTMPEESYEQLEGIDVLIMNALRIAPHPTHQNLEEAFANSCNGAFADIGMMLDQKKLSGTTRELLYDQNLPVPLSYSKSVFTEAAQDDTWQILLTAIGQGKTQITPMHSAMITAAIANGGTLMKPYLMDHVVNAAGEMVKAFTPEAYGNLMTASEAEILGTMMRAVVTEGTGSKLKNDQYTVAGKTGSAEFETGKETHAWFTGYAPAENPQLAVSVIVEEGGSGGAAAAPIARAVFDNWFSRNK